jgi:hypothetical protein
MSDADTNDEMTIPPEIISGVSQMRQRAEMLAAEIGRMEIRKSAIITEITMLNDKSTAMLRQEADRLGIPAGAEWQVTPEGKVIVKEG